MSCPACKGTGRLWVHTMQGGGFLKCPMCPLHGPRYHNSFHKDTSKRIQPLPTDLQGHICINMNCPQGDSPHFHVKV